MKKKIRDTFDAVLHVGKEETLSRLGISAEKREVRIRPRRLVVAAVCLVLVGTLGTAFALASSDGGLLSFFLPAEGASRAPSLPEESEEIPYFAGRVILSSTGWREEAGNLVTGEFQSLAEAFAAVEEGLPTEHPLYHPTWDGDGKGTYGTGSLIVLLNDRVVVDPATLAERHYPCLQINYQTKSVVSLQIHIGRTLGVPEGDSRRYETEAGVFYLKEWVHPVTGEVTYFATADIAGCGYEIQASSEEAAKRMADSLVVTEE